MQANINYAKRSSVLSALALVAILVFGVIGSVGLVNLNSNLKSVGEKFDEFDVDEQAIADAIVAGIVIPDMPEVKPDEKVEDIWDVMFSGCISDLEANAIEDTSDRQLVDWSDVKEDVEDEIPNFDFFVGYESEEENDGRIFMLDEEEPKVTIVELGECKIFDHVFNEDEDKKAIVVFEYDFKYEKDDSDKIYKDTLYVTVEVEYDEGDFDDKDLEVTYSL